MNIIHIFCTESVGLHSWAYAWEIYTVSSRAAAEATTKRCRRIKQNEKGFPKYKAPPGARWLYTYDIFGSQPYFHFDVGNLLHVNDGHQVYSIKTKLDLAPKLVTRV